jgi:hypothetical protein
MPAGHPTVIALHGAVPKKCQRKAKRNEKATAVVLREPAAAASGEEKKKAKALPAQLFCTASDTAPRRQEKSEEKN